MVTSSPKLADDDPSILVYNGAANVSITNIYMADFFATAPSVGVAVFIKQDSGCVPNDGMLQTFYMNNLTYSLPENPYGFRYNNIG